MPDRTRCRSTNISVEGYTAAPDEDARYAYLNLVSRAAIFDAMESIRRIDGRDFEDLTAMKRRLRKVAIVDQGVRAEVDEGRESGSAAPHGIRRWRGKNTKLDIEIVGTGGRIRRPMICGPTGVRVRLHADRSSRADKISSATFVVRATERRKRARQFGSARQYGNSIRNLPMRGR